MMMQKSSVEHQRRLNPVMKDVRKEVLKWLNAGFIYTISDRMSPDHVVPKKAMDSL